MTSIFEVETIVSKWAPPFTKENTTQVFNVKKGELFDLETHMKEETFMLKEENGAAAIVEYDRRFIPKKGIYSANMDSIAPQTMRLHQGKAVEFSFMWGEIGITKKITYQGMTGEKVAPKEEVKIEEPEKFDTVDEA